MTDAQAELTRLPRAERLRATLAAAFSPAHLDIVDESSKHAGHAGARAGGETHYTVTIVSDNFTNRTRVERSRMVYAALDSEFSTGLHALSLQLHSPDEQKS